jgi:hypothetical protein
MAHDDKSAADLFAEVGRAITGDSESWQHQLTEWLGVRRDTVRDWRRGRNELQPSHAVWDRLLVMIAERRTELDRVDRELRAWLERNRTAAPEEGRTEKGSENPGTRPLKS